MSLAPLHAEDQAAGLRRLFGASRRIIALASGPSLGCAGVAVERMASALAGHTRHLLVVDAGDASPPLPESAVWGLSSAVDRLSPSMAYLPARGLPRRCIDVHGSSAGLLDEFCRAQPQADVLLIHAGAMDLVRLLKGHALRPVVACSDDLDGVKEAYATVKLLGQRAGWVTFDLLVMGERGDVPAGRVAEALASCAERHAGCTLRTWATLNPRVDPRIEPEAALRALVACQVDEAKFSLTDSAPPVVTPARSRVASPPPAHRGGH
jgi:flagellar biosynthesis protein FlhG